MTLRDKYPNAYEDEKGTIWVSQQAAEAADWSFEFGDAFLDNILGWDWREAEENFQSCQRRDKRRAFWKQHPRLRDMLWFLRRWCGALWLFSRTVWRDWFRSKPRRGRVKGKDMESLRREVFERDGYSCKHKTWLSLMGGVMWEVCNKPVTWETGHLAHIESRGAGGPDTAENTYCCCAEHHLRFHQYGPSMAKPVPKKPVDID
ncbi:unnamed protein product [Sphagnum jensenii]